jgi:formyltetrahydrofolate deformylase
MESGTFFMRVEWSLNAFSIPREKISEYFLTLYGVRYGMTFRLYFSDELPRMAIFVSHQAHCLYDILSRHASGEWRVEIPLIISNHAELDPVGERFGIPFRVIPITPESKWDQEMLELNILKELGIDFIVLARYMQVLTNAIIDQYPDGIINIHHSFLPAFAGGRPYHAAFARGVKLIGATSHYVTGELDGGPIIEQDIVRITHKDDISALIRKGRDLEKIVLSRAIEKHISRKVLTYRNKTVIFD